MRTDKHSVLAWIVLGVIALIFEGYLYFIRDHTLSEQMRYWIRNAKLGSGLVIFWAWLLYHFTFEPIIRFIKKLLTKR